MANVWTAPSSFLLTDPSSCFRVRKSLNMGEELRTKLKIEDNDDMEEVEKCQEGDQTFYVIKTDHEQTFQVKQTRGPFHQDRARL